MAIETSKVKPEAANREPMRDPMHVEPRRRRRSTVNNDSVADKFYFPVDQIPIGSSYEWKRFSVMGQEDPFYIAALREQGWEPVDPKRHANLLPPGYSQPYIMREGLILMERPMELTKEAENEQRTLAKRQVREAEQRLGMTPNNTLPRDHPSLANAIGIHKEIGRMVVDE